MNAVTPDPAAEGGTTGRTATPRHYLMCAPTHFTVSYAINPWMDPSKPVDTALALVQWERLRALYESLGHRVHLVEPVAGLPDMVYAANGATVIDGKVLGARFRNAERAAEGSAYLDWFRAAGYTAVHDPEQVNEGRATSSSPTASSSPDRASVPAPRPIRRPRSSSADRSSASNSSTPPTTTWTLLCPCSTATRSCITRRRSRRTAGPS